MMVREAVKDGLAGMSSWALCPEAAMLPGGQGGGGPVYAGPDGQGAQPGAFGGDFEDGGRVGERGGVRRDRGRGDVRAA